MPNGEIDRQAALWVARYESRALTPGEQQALDAWLAADPRQFGAFVRARAVWRALDRGQALATPAAPASMPDRWSVASQNRRWLIGTLGSAAAAAAVAAAWIGRPAPPPAGLRFATGRREIRTLALSDGSRTVLNAASDVSFAFDQSRRLVTLDRGEGWFEVAKDRQRPFIVRVAEVEARAVGTAFAVTRGAASVEITVSEGIVEIVAPQGRVRITAGGRAAIPKIGEIQIAALAPEALDRDLAWRERRIILDGETLAYAAARFNRFNAVKIVIDDPVLAGEPVVGSFDLFASEQFADAVQIAFSATLRRGPGTLILSGRGT